MGNNGLEEEADEEEEEVNITLIIHSRSTSKHLDMEALFSMLQKAICQNHLTVQPTD
jgi:hypothetical protein